MARPVIGKRYLFVICKSCSKGFRVVDEPLYEGKRVEIREAKTLTCRGCGHKGVYELGDMRIARVRHKPEQRA